MKNWMKLTGALTFVIALGLAGIYLPNRSPTTDGIAKVITSAGVGSSFQIKDGVWLTAAHVLPDGNPVILQLRDGREIKAEVRWSDKFRDVAMLVAPKGMNIEVLPLACYTPKIGDFVLHRGHPFGLAYGEYRGAFATDAILADDRVPMWPEFYVTDITAAPGSSGGILQRSGYAVGMVVGQFSRAPTMMITLSGKYLCDVVKWQEETIEIKRNHGT